MKQILLTVLLLLLGIAPSYAKRQPYTPPQVTVQCDKVMIENALLSKIMAGAVITSQTENSVHFRDPNERNIYGHTEYVFHYIPNGNSTSVSVNAFWVHDVSVAFTGANDLGAMDPITSKKWQAEANNVLSQLKQCELMTSDSTPQHQ